MGAHWELRGRRMREWARGECWRKWKVRKVLWDAAGRAAGGSTSGMGRTVNLAAVKESQPLEAVVQLVRVFLGVHRLAGAGCA